jgi:hypothetical protein
MFLWYGDAYCYYFSSPLTDNGIELRKDISVLNKSPKVLHGKAQGNALGKCTIIFLSSERA